MGKKGVTCSMHDKNRKCIQNFGEKPEEKRSSGRPRCRWESNVKVGLNERVCKVVD